MNKTISFRKAKIAAGIMLGLLLIVPLLACANPETSATLTSQEVIEKYRTAIKEVRSFRYESISEASEDNQTQRSEIFAEYVLPDRSHLVIKDDRGTTDEVVIGETRYEKLPGNEAWVARKYQQPFTASQTISTDWAATFDEMNITQISDEEIEGIACYHYKGIRDAKAAADKIRANIDKLDPTSAAYVSLKESQERLAEITEKMVTETEFWIGKNDFLLRKSVIRQEYAMKKNSDSINETNFTMSGSFRYFDFNVDIKIEVPSLVEGVNLTANTSSSSGIDNAQYNIMITNIGTETANNVRVFLDTSATDNGRQTFEAEPEINQDSIFPSATINYNVAWDIDVLAMGKERFLELIKEDVIRCKWTDADGSEKEKILTQGGLPIMR